MAELIDIRELYLSIATSMDDANRQLEVAAEKGEFSFAITDLEFSIPFNELVIEEGRVGISLARENDTASEVRNVRFRVQFVPRPVIREVEEEKPIEPRPVIPDVLNKTLDDAITQIEALGLQVGKVSYDPTKKPAGHIVSQIPIPLTRSEPGQTIDLVVSGEAPKPKPKRARAQPKRKDEKP